MKYYIIYLVIGLLVSSFFTKLMADSYPVETTSDFIITSLTFFFMTMAWPLVIVSSLAMLLLTFFGVVFV